MKSIRKMMLVKFLLLGALAAAVATGSLSAQNRTPATAGEFTLPFEVHWGKSVLPAGDYSFSVSSEDNFPLVTIRGKKQGGFVMAAGISKCSSCGSSVLLVFRSGQERTVQALRLASLGVILYFGPRSQVDELLAQAPKSIERVPILVADK